MKTILKLFLLISINTQIYAQQSDPKAIAIAKEVMQQMGGEEQWNNTHFIQWDFGKRTLYWDKWTGDVRVEAPNDALVILVNINTMKGKAYQNGTLVQDKQQTKKLLKKGKNWWINDSYWLTMPWKLLDPGVTLTYLRTDTLPNGAQADVLQMTFENVGVTPNNKYEIFVDQQEKLVKQWAFFKNYQDTKPKFSKPWDNYQKLGKVWLSFNRSDFGPKNVVVKDTFDAQLFTNL
ncbi:hypothetical protein [Ochrovirga pacifica]|uniref:hypothetical protein n=1 Tax=Ochrovirga pacifica TaxID=1042376 RepID=UPI0002558B42|nr:hypothetical protein [Ochrovirga pacifica]